jgi:hypothetical protein
MTASVVMVDFLLGQNNPEQWRAGLVNVREIMTNVINLGVVLQSYHQID